MPKSKMLSAEISKERGIREIALKKAKAGMRRTQTEIAALAEAMMESPTGEGAMSFII